MVPRVTVLGANGYTGRFVLDLLRRRGARPAPATRSGDVSGYEGDRQSCHAIDFTRPLTLDKAMLGADAVINCAGPFFDTSEPAIEAALRARIPYLDVTAEQKTALRIFETFDARAKGANVPIVPAMAFYGGLADLLLSALVQDQDRVDTAEIAVGLDSWHPTRGTRRTGEQNRFARMIIRNGNMVPVPSPPPSRIWNFPDPLGEQRVTCVPLTEIVLISRHIEVGAVTSFMNLKPLEDLQDPRTPPPRASGASGRSPQQFILDVCAISGGRRLRATASGRDIYAASATLVVNACLDLLGKDSAKSGVRAPGEVFEPRTFLTSLSPDLNVHFSTLT